MEYCSINEAWGQDKITNQYKKYQNSEKSVEHFEPIDPTTNSYSDINHTPTERLTYQKDLKKKRKKYSKHITESEVFHTTDTMSSILSRKCSKLITHISKCKKCKRKLRNKFRPKLIEKLEYLFEDYREVFVLILLGISLLVFINLVQSIVSNKNN